MMPDNPHTHPDGSFMLAAEKQVDTLIKGAKLHKIQLRILTAVCAVILVVCGVLGYVVKAQYDTTQELRQDSVTNCNAGNGFKAGQKLIWVTLIKLSEGNKGKNAPTAQAKAEIKTLEKTINTVDAPRNCNATYSLHGASAFLVPAPKSH